MCGIAGILSGDGGGLALRDRVAAMQHALAHRGPDDRGQWLSAGGHAAFANTRLAILDPSPAGHQPMTIDNGRLTITFNGEIYNFRELRRELERDGIPFYTRTDTEVVLRAYDAYGDACVERLRGMFAFAIWDESARRCLLARDRFGIKPLYYSLRRGRLIFASELRAAVASGLIEPSVDASAAYEYFRAGSVPEPHTLVAGVKCLAAGQRAVWREGELTAATYFDLSFASSSPAIDAVAMTRQAVVDSLSHHFVSDVPVGIFLSGGLDSTALLALAREAGRGDVRALTMATPGSPDDEAALARRTARHFGARHDVVEVDGASATTLFADYLKAMDQPSIDGMNTLAVSQLARSCGLKVMLSGIGADELFGGYPSIQAVPKFTAWNRRLAAANSMRTAAGQLLERFADPRWRRIGDMLGQDPWLSASYAAFRGIFTRAEARALTRQFASLEPEVHRSPDRLPVDPTPQDAVCRLEMTRYLRNQLLRDADVMSMACGVEVRVPFLDPVVVSTVNAVPQQQRLSPAKALLRRAVPEIPSWIASQPKRGFTFPMDQWLGNEWSGVFADTDARCSVPTGTWYRKWCVRAFEVWLDRLRATPAATEPYSAVMITRGVNG